MIVLRAIARVNPLRPARNHRFQSQFNIPNLLSGSRIIASPISALLILNHNYSIALGLIAWGGASDLLDGWIARRYKLETKIGSFLDPIGDKIMTFSIASALCLDGAMPLWLCASLICRDVSLIAATAFIKFRDKRRLQNMQVSPFTSGKIHTAIQFLLFCLYLLMLRDKKENDGDKKSDYRHLLKTLLEGSLSISLVWSTWKYARGYKNAIKIN